MAVTTRSRESRGRAGVDRWLGAALSWPRRLLRAVLYGGSWSEPQRIGIIVAAFAFHTIVFAWLFDSVGAGLGALSALPVVAAGTLLGVRAGIVVALLMVPANTAMLNAFAVHGWDALVTRGGVPGSLILLLLGAGTGWLRELNVRVRRQAAELETQRHALQGQVVEAERQRGRREMLLRVARRIGAESNRDDVLAALLAEAVAILGGHGGAVFRLDVLRGDLVLVTTTWSASAGSYRVPLGEGASGLAALNRSPAIINDYVNNQSALTDAVNVGVRASVAVPLLYEGKLLGSIAIGSLTERAFGAEDAELLEVLAGIASATLVGLERARLEGVLLAARTAEHEINNRLSATVGYASLLAADPSLPAHLVKPADDIVRGATGAARVVQQLARVTELHETPWGPTLGPTLDLSQVKEQVTPD